MPIGYYFLHRHSKRLLFAEVNATMIDGTAVCHLVEYSEDAAGQKPCFTTTSKLGTIPDALHLYNDLKNDLVKQHLPNSTLPNSPLAGLTQSGVDAIHRLFATKWIDHVDRQYQNQKEPKSASEITGMLATNSFPGTKITTASYGLDREIVDTALHQEFHAASNIVIGYVVGHIQPLQVLVISRSLKQRSVSAAFASTEVPSRASHKLVKSQTHQTLGQAIPH
jgi:hypothetical protein